MFKALLTRFEGSQLVKDETGATAVEYGLIVSLIAVAVIGALMAVGTQLDLTFDGIADSLTP